MSMSGHLNLLWTTTVFLWQQRNVYLFDENIYYVKKNADIRVKV